MTSNTDNAMARFLFAILKQKNLKDIDWNKVANDPVLLQPISNGHAARMRYSRFRNSVTNKEPRKIHGSTEKSRVSKSASAPTSVKHVRVKKETMVKSESSISLASLPQFTPDVSPYMNDLGDDFENPRFMTPCSDDMTQPLSGRPLAINPLAIYQGFDMEASSETVKHESADEDSPVLSAFEAAYDLSNFGASQSADVAHSQTLWPENLEDGQDG